MKVKIKKKGKTKEFNLIKSWSDVTLEKWIKLANARNKSKSKEALENIKLLSDIPKKLIKELGVQDVAIILSKITELQQKADGRLKDRIKVNGVEYGFHPKLVDMTLGEFVDLETYMKDMNEYLHKILSVLYRPVIKKDEEERYLIEEYKPSEERADLFKKKLTVKEFNGASVFFYDLEKELTIHSLQSLIQNKKEIQNKDISKNVKG